MNTANKKIWIITIFIFSFFSCYTQWNESWFENLYADNIGICFTSSDTGYIVRSIIWNNHSCYYRTIDRGLNWSIMDTTDNYLAKDIVCKFGFNMSYGTCDENAAVEVFEDDLMNRELFQFSDYKEISEINVINSNNAVFSGIDSNSVYVIGIISKVSGTIELNTLRTFGSTPIDKIKFFTVNQGYYLMNSHIYYFDNNNVQILRISNVYDFDFYSLDTGVVFSTNIYKTYNSGESWENVGSILTNNFRGIIMNSNNSLYIFDVFTINSSEAYFYYITLDDNNIIPPETSYTQGTAQDWELYFYSKKQGYFISTEGCLLWTLNNGGFTSVESTMLINMPLNLYPNPCDNVLNIEINAENYGEKTISIINSQGQIIKSRFVSFNQNHATIDISDLENGVYLMQVTNEKRRYKKAFIKL